MTQTQTSLLTDADIARELAGARLKVNELIEQIRSFTTFAHDKPWVHLDDLLADLRAAVTVVTALEYVQGRAG